MTRSYYSIKSHAWVTLHYYTWSVTFPSTVLFKYKHRYASHVQQSDIWKYVLPTLFTDLAM